MPLSEGTGKASREENIRREIEAGKDPKQAVAIGYAKQRENIAKSAHDCKGLEALINGFAAVNSALKGSK